MNPALIWYNYRGSRRGGALCSFTQGSRFSLTRHVNEPLGGIVDCSYRIPGGYSGYSGGHKRCSAHGSVSMLDGMQGESILDVGYVHAPYYPEYHEPEINVEDFSPPSSTNLAPDFQDMMGYVTSADILPS